MSKTGEEESIYSSLIHLPVMCQMFSLSGCCSIEDTVVSQIETLDYSLTGDLNEKTRGW